MNITNMIRKYRDEGYVVADAESKTAQDIILSKISKSKFKEHITIKGGVVMHSISKDKRRATRDLDLDFIKYSLDDDSIKDFIKLLDNVDDGIYISVDGEIKPLHHQDYDGKRVFIKIKDEYNNEINTKIDIGVHKLFEIMQDDYFTMLATSSAKLSFLFSRPSPFSKRVKLSIEMLPPSSLATLSVYLAMVRSPSLTNSCSVRQTSL